MTKTEEQVLIEETYNKSKHFEDIADRLIVLEDFRELTTSSSLPIGLKNRFLAIADQDINRLVACL